MNGFCFLLQDCITYSQSASMEHLCPLLPPDCQNHWSFLSLPPPCLATDLKIAPQITPQTSDPPFNQQCFPQDACIWTLSQPECCNTNHLPPSPSQPPSSVATALKHAWDQDSYTMATSCHYVSDCSAITTCRSMDQFISQRSLLIWQAIKSGQYAMTNYTWATLSKKIAANSKQQCTKYSLKHVRIPFYRSWSKILTPNISWTNLHDASGNGSHAAATTCMHTSRWLNFKHVFVHAIFINISLGACHKQQQIKICCTPLISINPSVSLSFCTKLVITL